MAITDEDDPVPDGLATDEFVLRPINLKDLVSMEERHLAHRAYCYTVLDPTGSECLGCVYIFPIGATFLTKATVTPVGDEKWEHVEAVVYFWARQSRVATGMDGRLLAALREWMRVDWNLDRVTYAVSELFTEQLDLIEGAGLAVQFELWEQDKPGRYLVFGQDPIVSSSSVTRSEEVSPMHTLSTQGAPSSSRSRD